MSLYCTIDYHLLDYEGNEIFYYDLSGKESRYGIQENFNDILYLGG